MSYQSRWRTDVKGGGGHSSRVAKDAPYRAVRKGESYSPVEHGYGSGRNHAADTDYGLSCMGARKGAAKRLSAGNGEMRYRIERD